MDIICPLCGESWDHDELHQVAEEDDSTYDKVAANFRHAGCAALGGKCSDNPDENKATLAAAMYEVNGSDMDGAASMFDEAEFLGYI